MELLRDGMIAALAAIGMTTVLYLALGIFFHPQRRGTLPAAAVVSAAGDAEKLEHTVRALEKSRYEEGGFARIVILDQGMTEEGRKIAHLLCRDDFDVYLCTADELPQYF